MERIFRVHTVKLAGPGLSSMSPQRRRQARRKGLHRRIAATMYSLANVWPVDLLVQLPH